MLSACLEPNISSRQYFQGIMKRFRCHFCSHFFPIIRWSLQYSHEIKYSNIQTNLTLTATHTVVYYVLFLHLSLPAYFFFTVFHVQILFIILFFNKQGCHNLFPREEWLLHEEVVLSVDYKSLLSLQAVLFFRFIGRRLRRS